MKKSKKIIFNIINFCIIEEKNDIMLPPITKIQNNEQKLTIVKRLEREKITTIFLYQFLYLVLCRRVHPILIQINQSFFLIIFETFTRFVNDCYKSCTTTYSSKMLHNTLSIFQDSHIKVVTVLELEKTDSFRTSTCSPSISPIFGHSIFTNSQIWSLYFKFWQFWSLTRFLN